MRILARLLPLLLAFGCGDDAPPSEDGGGRPDSGAIDASPPADGGSELDAREPVDAALPPVVFPGASWEMRTPAEVGLDEAMIDDFADRIGGDGCLVRDGYLVRTWGEPTRKADWASASKPVTSTLLFFAIEEGLVSGVDHPISDFWPLRPDDATMTFRHLADMTSGYSRGEGPGEAWAYNDEAIQLYKLTMRDYVFSEATLDDAARRPERLGALGFEDGSIYSSRGGLGVSTSCRDFARIGWFWLNRGRWGDAQLLPRSYFDEYMQPDVPGDLPRTSSDDDEYLGVGTLGGGDDQTPYGPGIYGFNWWFNAEVGTTGFLTWPDAPPDTFQANGHFDREIVTVIPSLRIVVAARGNWGTFQPGNASATMNENLALLAAAAD